MRVGFVIYGDLDNTSGGFLYDRKLIAYLRDRGDDVDVISLPWRTYHRHLSDNVSTSVYRKLNGRYDVLVQDELCHPSLLVPNRLLDRAYPIVSIVHSAKTAETRSSRWNRLFRAIERNYLTTTDGVISNSQSTSKTIDRLVDVPEVVVPPGRGHRSPEITREEIESRARETPLRIVFVGNLIPRKGAHVLVEALARLPRDDWQLTIIGGTDSNPQYVSQLRRRIARHDLETSVTLAGRVSDEDLAASLRRQHLLAVPSSYEAFGIAYLEGMGFGLPAIATTAGGAADIVSDGENGFLVPPGEPRSIADAVESVLDERTRLREMSVTARETYEAHHSWADVGNRIRQFLRRLVTDGAECSRPNPDSGLVR